MLNMKELKEKTMEQVTGGIESANVVGIMSNGQPLRAVGMAAEVPNSDIHIEDKEFIVLVGPSGCGKPE